MNSKMRICVVTGTRAEYGLLYWTIKKLKKDSDIQLQLVVTGMHLSPEFGLTYRQIEYDGFNIDKKIEILLSSDTTIGINKSIGVGIMSFGEAFAELKPDLILVLGDRFEIFAAATAAMISRIPIAHCHGGEATEGLIDEPIRHSITKMSQLHFTAADAYRKRVIQLGEQPERVFNVGALGIESINKLKLLSRSEFEESIDFKLGAKNLLVTFHPVTLESSSAERQFTALLEILNELDGVHVVFTKSNADTDGRIINQLIEEYVAERRDRTVVFTSLGQLRYLSALQYVDAVVGNSSSGIIEVPSFGIPTVNIGDRQRGRLKAASIIDCEPNKEAMRKGIYKALDAVFKLSIKGVVNPYGKGNASDEIVRIIKETPLDSLLKKHFYDL